MEMVNLKTYSAKQGEVEKKWYLIDAEGKNLGRTAAKIASILKGKTKPEYTPSMDVGDFVVVINSEKIEVTGKKETDKKYYRHSGYPGGLKTASLGELRESYPDRILYNAVKGMLPKNSLGRKMLTKLRVVVGADHKFQAQKPETIDV